MESEEGLQPLPQSHTRSPERGVLNLTRTTPYCTIRANSELKMIAGSQLFRHTGVSSALYYDPLPL